jgi:hypothetical protein
VSTGWSLELLAAAVDRVDVLDGSGSGVGSAEGSGAGSGTGSGAGSWLCVGVASVSTGTKAKNVTIKMKQNKTHSIRQKVITVVSLTASQLGCEAVSMDRQF